jgi:hypothetical protein
MNMPLMEFFNYFTIIKAKRKEREKRLNAARALGYYHYQIALMEESL